MIIHSRPESRRRRSGCQATAAEAVMTDATIERPTSPTNGASSDKREAILAAALRLIARLGLHAAPMSAVAREAGVAAGTLYLYFPSKEAMINALYLEVLEDRMRAIIGESGMQAAERLDDARAALWRSWYGHARWHLDHPDSSNLLLQCQTSGILTAETREIQQRIEA